MAGIPRLGQKIMRDVWISTGQAASQDRGRRGGCGVRARGALITQPRPQTLTLAVLWCYGWPHNNQAKRESSGNVEDGWIRRKVQGGISQYSKRLYP
jgi:hypothetical protein